MTREKKASITLELMMIGLTYKLNGNEMLSENEADSTRNAIDALDVAIAALRGPQPDPTTGLVPCGCGCEPELRDEDRGWYQVYCTGCDMHGGNSHTPDGVIEEWNTAMGMKEGVE